MPEHKKKKHSRSRSRDRDRNRSRRTKVNRIDKIQNQINNLTKVVETLVQTGHKATEQSANIAFDREISGSNIEESKEINQEENTELSFPEISAVEKTLKDNVLKVLGADLNESKFKAVNYHPELENTWSKWMKQGLPEKNKKEILECYNRKGVLYTEAPKVNLEIVPLLSEIAKKRDQHILDTQNCIGTAIAALGAAVSLLIDPPEEGVDEDIFTDYLSHAGQILTDVFYQQSLARKSFITPQLNKNIKPTVDTMIADEWLYGNELKEKVKDAKEIEKACAGIKEKVTQKVPTKYWNQGNLKYPPARYRQVGYPQKRRHFNFKKKAYQTSQSNSTKSSTQTTNQSSSKK